MGVPVFICKAQASNREKQPPVNRFAEEGGKYGIRRKTNALRRIRRGAIIKQMQKKEFSNALL